VFFYTEYDTNLIKFSYSSLVQPVIFYSYNMSNHLLSKISEQTFRGYNKDLFQDRRINVTVRDGYSVPVTLVYRKDLRVENRTNPMLLSGYGAYGDISFPFFDCYRLSLLNRGFIFAIVHVRGGAIRGSPWYFDGKLLNKKHTFYDFIDCSQYFIDHGWTRSDQLVAFGRSAGGLLMGAVLTMRPDLFRVVWAQVPFVDVINDMFDPTIPWVVWEYWEWGNPQNETFYHYMKSYDPYGHVASVQYPSVLLESGWNDVRVMYWEPTKLIAKLRYSQLELSTDTSDNNNDSDSRFILRTIDAGHMGSSGDSYFADLAFQYAFLIDQVQSSSSPASYVGTNLVLWIWIVIGAVLISLVLAVIALVWRRYHRFFASYTLLRSNERSIEQDNPLNTAKFSETELNKNESIDPFL